MSERATLRGSRLGGTSFEDESGIEFAPRQRVVYDCPQGSRERQIPHLFPTADYAEEVRNKEISAD